MLGPVEVWDERGVVAVGGTRGHCILAALLLNAGQVVSVDQLIDAAWGEHPPASARVQAQNWVSRLRRALRTAQPQGDPISTKGSGYLIHLDAGQLDLAQFEDQVARADALAAVGRRGEAAAALAAALAFWRGPALDGLATPYLVAAAQRLEEQRLRARERRIELDLELGRHAELVAELSGLTEAHPYREGMHALLMRALYRSGRQAEALQVYRRVRAVLVDQLGVEPGAELQELHEAMLRGEHILDQPDEEDAPLPLVPRELPGDVSGFTGRDHQLTALDSMVGDRRGAVVITAIAGTAGVGKTALAVHWAHRVANEFPDGQLYVNLRGYATGLPVRPAEALGILLRSLGVPPERVPVDIDEAATLYRSRLAGRRVLVLADNARSVDQVRPLLPGTPGCLVLVTSRDRLGGLVAREGALRLTLDVLTADEAQDLLIRILGVERVTAEQDAAAELAGVCAYLPLALRIAAANLVLRPHRSIADHVAELRDERGLAALAIDGDEEAAVQIALDLSYETVPKEAQRLFRLLGLVPGPDVTPGAAAALAGIGPDEAGRLLERLAAAHLMEEHSPDRYAFHDLLRRFARQWSEKDDGEGERTAALRNLFDWYLDAIGAAADVLYPHMARLTQPADAVSSWPRPSTAETALAWLDGEQHNLVGAIHHAASHGPRRFAVLLAHGMRGYFARRRHLTDWLATSHAALSAAEEDGDLAGQVAMHQTLAQVHYSLGQYRQAVDQLMRALMLNGDDVWAAGHASILGNLGLLYEELGRLDESIDHHTRSLKLHREAGRRHAEALSLNNMANAKLLKGRLLETAATAHEALRIFRETGDAGGSEGTVVETLGTAYLQLGRHHDALEMANLSLTLHRKHGNRYGEAESLVLLATIHSEAGRHHRALELASAAHTLGREIGEPRTNTTSLTALAAIHGRIGDHDRALSQFTSALAAAKAIETPYGQALAMVGIAVTERCLGHHDIALNHAQQALDLAQRHQFGVVEGRALTALAEIHLDRGDRHTAARYAENALANHRETGHRLGEARTLALLGDVLDDAETAQRHRAEARKLLGEINPYTDMLP